MELKKILSQLKHSSEWVSLRKVHNKQTSLMQINGKPQNSDLSSSLGVMIEVLHNGIFSYGATSDITLQTIQTLLTHIEETAKTASRHNLYKATINQRPPVVGRFSTQVEIPLDSVSLGEISSRFYKAHQALKNNQDKIISTTTGVSFSEQSTEFVSTNGSDVMQSMSFITPYMSVTAQDGPIIQTRSLGVDHSRQLGLEFITEQKLIENAERFHKDVLELLSAPECPEETMDLVLNSDQMLIQIHESIGHPLEIDRILGDERNYAGWSFVNPSDFGKLQYGSKLLNVTFDPTYSSLNATYQFDDAGTPAKKEYLIKDGLLLRGLGGIDSQTRSGLPGVSNFRSQGWNRAPIDRIGNVNIEPGETSFEKMISSIERGLFLTTHRSWSIDDFRRKFQFGCEYGQLIENGQLTKTVRNSNYRGITTEFWNNLVQVGDRSTYSEYGSPYCGKGEPNQIIKVGHAAPICHFKNIEVFGGGK